MRKISILFTLIINIAVSQNIKAVYQLDRIGAKQDNVLIDNKQKPSFYSYIFTKDRSIYDLNTAQSTSVDTIHNSYGKTLNVNNLPSQSFLFKNFNSLDFINEFVLTDKIFSIKDQLIQYSWELLDERKIINGFSCKKAKTTDLYKLKLTAWYCEDIAINDGPDRYWGLPGLIFEVEVGSFSIITLKEIQVIKDGPVITEPKTNSELLTITEFNIKFNEYLSEMNSRN